MEKLGFVRLTSDAGIFIYRQGTNFVIVIVYVDDILFLGKDKGLLVHLKNKFMKHWECRDLGDAQEFLRMRITRKKGKIYLDQVSYLKRVLERFGMSNARVAPTPLPAGYTPAENKKPADPKLRTRFQSVIGSLLYLMLGTRPDIAYAVIKLAKFAANPSKEHLDKALYICRYLAGTQDYSLVYDGTSDAGLIAFTDSDWASDPIDRKSITGFFFKLANGSINWASHTQKSVANSSTAAEYMALSDCCHQTMWIKSLLEEIGIPLKPIPICADNQGAIFIGSNPVAGKGTKHIEVRYHNVRECVEKKKVELLYIEGSENPADMFTKNLGHVKFFKFREQLGLEFYSPSSA
jgi:hypothetical protein